MLVTGLPFTEVNETVLRLGLLIGVIGVAGVAAAALAGTVVVRGALRPLDRVAATATRVSELPLDRGEVALAEQVPRLRRRSAHRGRPGRGGPEPDARARHRPR